MKQRKTQNAFDCFKKKFSFLSNSCSVVQSFSCNPGDNEVCVSEELIVFPHSI